MKAPALSLLILVSATFAFASDESENSAADLAAIAYVNPTALKNILFVHGTPGSADAFSFYVNDKELRAEVSLISVDRIGFGKSGKQPEVSLKAHSEAVLKTLNSKFGKQSSICVGHSYGATLCLDLVARYPERFERAVVIAGAFNPYRKILRWYNYAASTWLVQAVISRSLINSNKEMYALKDELVGLESRFDQIKVPVQIIHGKKDKIVPYGDSTWLLKKLKEHKVDVNLKTYEADGHFIIWKQEESIKKDLLGLIKHI